MQYGDSKKPKLLDKIKSFLITNRFKIIFLIIVIIIIFSIFYYLIFYPRQQQKQIDDADLQAKCNNQAIKILNDTQRNVSDVIYTHKSHFISSFNRCYVWIHGVGVGDIGISDKLIYVYDNNEIIANCESYASAPELNFCSYNGSKLEYNIDQFNSFIKPYMETN